MATLIVASIPARGRHRAGYHFTREQSIVEVDAAQEEAIRADPMLRVFEDAPVVKPAPMPEPMPEPDEDVKPARGKR